MVGGGGCSCMLLLHPVPTSADAGPDLCTLCPDHYTLHPDLCTLRLWLFPFFQLVQPFHSHTWWYHPRQLALVVLIHPVTIAKTADELEQKGWHSLLVYNYSDKTSFLSIYIIILYTYSDIRGKGIILLFLLCQGMFPNRIITYLGTE